MPQSLSRQSKRFLPAACMVWVGITTFTNLAFAEESPVHLVADVGTDFPISVGGRVQLELPGRLRLSSGLGYLPEFYANGLNAAMRGFGVYNEATGQLITSSYSSSLTWRANIGWRPFAGSGFYFEGGYQLVTLGGGSTPAALIQATTGQTLPASESGVNKQFTISTTTQMVDVEVGWEWFIADDLHIRAAMGGVFTVASSSTIANKFTPTSPQATAAFERASEQKVNALFTSYVHMPVISFSVGYKFF